MITTLIKEIYVKCIMYNQNVYNNNNNNDTNDNNNYHHLYYHYFYLLVVSVLFVSLLL